MHVAHGTGDLAGRNLEDLDRQRRVQIVFSPRLNFSVAALLDERGQPPDFELPPDDDEQIRTLQFQDEAGFGLDEVRILLPLGNRLDSDAIPAHLARD